VAVEQRLARAGLAPSDFDHMTHSGNSRFLKPSAYYYADILRTLDLPAGSVAMIGNDPVRDGAARQVGIRTLIVAPARDENRAAEQVRAFLRGA
jgi:FMN phosphatase YigB (HAD superfamily)